MSNMPPPSFSGTGPTSVADCEALAAQLLDPNVPTRRKTDIASELRDSAEGNKDTSFYEKYLGVLMPAVMTVLADERTIHFIKDSPDQVRDSTRRVERYTDV
jgi:transformation/transcription domain-associated protein